MDNSNIGKLERIVGEIFDIKRRFILPKKAKIILNGIMTTVNGIIADEKQSLEDMLDDMAKLYGED